ncbi:hypothetical protein Bbelb_291190 [Branchiostoma belcheri]|nr:hypothetical protein Bbelb_291190 [Branchiostoma belcheri]
MGQCRSRAVKPDPSAILYMYMYTSGRREKVPFHARDGTFSRWLVVGWPAINLFHPPRGLHRRLETPSYPTACPVLIPVKSAVFTTWQNANAEVTGSVSTLALSPAPRKARHANLSSYKTLAFHKDYYREIADLKDARASVPQTVLAPRHTTFADVVADKHSQSIVHPPAARRASGPTQAHVLVPGPEGPCPGFSLIAPRGHSSGVLTAPDEDGFNVVKRKKNRPRAVVGTAKSSTLSAIKARPVEIFVTRLGPDTKSEDVERYLHDNLSHDRTLSCTNLPTKFDSYSSFRVSIESEAVAEILSPSFWPCGVLVRRYHGRRASSTPQPRP